ncbi:4-hydroxy-3-methylbut-2-enyl diphosphate reductase [Berryella wangjianweii]|uniref:4-hydroxy-3-methylbut-2-enyl diphosphate reductase n=1 Tax=Berryella wangjianweii TaxID=2734634 RepID=A0A6M8J5P8_9ACTN|nr:4-hydroxy-3-methylbut-2-enyl diphosphate reductase [Berryella wangjianweii]NPD32464.1 4-hydroxy-3-methylbut-2-enyl diphosphate reductase [Eggerthellaceae bacterium zg-997]QKF06779.1 4-hydroxy-3-methylbut-2-enyl diphosphate reductase [Berryella wangjianweii]
MKVVRAKFAGACYGVQRALDLALRSVADGQGAHTLGPLIHNPQVVQKLADQGVTEISSIDEVSAGSSVVIRSHGVTPQVMRSVEATGSPVVDATCPHVSRAQRAAAQLAQQHGTVVVVGEAGHPEVEGLVACALERTDRVYAVTSADQLPADIQAPVGIVVQTTQQREALDSVVAALRGRGIEPEVRNTICFATSQRQGAAADLASEVDALVVIGGRNSSNTTRLADICKERCPRTYHIESVDEIDPAWFAGAETVGITAGASTPEDQIDAVQRRLEQL